MENRLKASIEWCKEHKDKWEFKPKQSYNKENYNKYHREYRKNPKNIVSDRLRHSINYSLRRMNIPRDGKNLKEMVTYSIEDLTKKLKETIPKGYTWQDFLDGKLDIDHKKPIVLFNYRDQKDKEFKECWALKNLRLLPIYKNRSRKFNDYNK